MSSNFEKAKLFFDKCERGEGWDAVKCYCTNDATFSGQCGLFHPPLAPAPNLGGMLENYVDWMKMVVNGLVPGCYRTDDSQAFDSDTNTALFFAVFHGIHSKTPEGSPLPPPTSKSVASDFVYAIHFNEDGKIDKMTKIWNSEWAAKDLGWS